MFKISLRLICLFALFFGMNANVYADTVSDVQQNCPFYSEYENLSYDLFKVRKMYFYGAIDKYCRVIIPLKYNDLSELNSNILVRSISSYGLFDYRGKEIIPVEYSSIKVLDNNFYEVRKDHMYGIISKEGIVIAQPYYNGVGTLGYSMFKIEGYDLDVNTVVGVLSKTGYEIFTPQFKSIRALSPAFFLANDSYSNKVIDILGNVYFNSNYANIEHLSDTYFRVKNNNKKYGVVDEKGDVIVDITYDKIESAKNGYFKVKNNGKWGATNALGDVVLECQNGPLEINKEIKNLPADTRHTSVYQSTAQKYKMFLAYYHHFSGENVLAEKLLENHSGEKYADLETKRLMNVLRRTLGIDIVN